MGAKPPKARERHLHRIELYERRRQVATDSADLLQLLLRIGDLYESRLRDVMGALKAYEGALQSAPDLYPALQGQLRCYLKLGDHPRARQTWEAIAQTARDPQTALKAMLDAAKLARDVERNQPAAEALFQVTGCWPLASP